MGMHFIWQRINVLLCLLLTKLILEDYLVIKCRFWLQNCVILDLNVPRACMFLLCCLAITFNQSIMIGLCPLHHLGSSLRFLWPFCVSVSLLNTLSFFFFFKFKLGASLVAQCKKIHLPVQEMWVWFLVQKDPLEKEMATHSSILAWEIPWTEEPGGYSPWGCKESDTT